MNGGTFVWEKIVLLNFIFYLKVSSGTTGKLSGWGLITYPNLTVKPLYNNCFDIYWCV